MSKAIDFRPKRNLIEVRADGTITGNYWENLSRFERERGPRWAEHRIAMHQQQIKTTIQETKKQEQQKHKKKRLRGGKGAPGYSDEEKLHLVYACINIPKWTDRLAYMEKQGYSRTINGLKGCQERMTQAGEFDELARIIATSAGKPCNLSRG